MINRRKLISLAISAVYFCSANRSQPQDNEDVINIVREVEKLEGMSLEELFSIEVSSVSKQLESISRAPAAIYVISGDEVKRAGVTTLPDALRLAPGLNVAQLDAHNWAVSSRGFQDVFANKLLVMIDGRTIYTPLFSGVFWDQQTVMLEDLDQIEVIRGPGATLWGANAVNGVINILSKNAKETQGALISAGYGRKLDAYGAARYGFQLGENTYMRVYAKGEDRVESIKGDGTYNNDHWHIAQGGFRLDHLPEDDVEFTLQGDIYMGEVSESSVIAIPNPPFMATADSDNQIDGANLLSRWKRRLDNGSQLQIQAYYDRVGREGTGFNEVRHTFDFEAQHSLEVGERHNVIYGAGVRLIKDDLLSSFQSAFDPSSRTVDQENLFVQDQIELLDETLSLTLGTKLGRNDFSGFEIQPNARLSWKASERATAWAAISRAVRTPSRAEHDSITTRALIPGTSPAPPGSLIRLVGSSGFDPEKLIAYEMGVRFVPITDLSVDVALFYNDYDDLRTIEPQAPEFGFPTFLPSTVDNKLKGAAYGAELALKYDITDNLVVRANYSFLELDLDLKNGSLFPEALLDEERTPTHQVSVRAEWDFHEKWALGAGLRFVSELAAPRIPNYVEMDLRLSWRPTKNLELSIAGRNLLDDQHPEFNPSFFSSIPSEVERNVFGMLTYEF